MPQQLTRTRLDIRRRLDANLSTGIPETNVRSAVRGSLGPQSFRHAHFSKSDFFHSEAERGIRRTVYGERVLFASGNFLAALTETLVQMAGGGVVDLLNRIGESWGKASYPSLQMRLEHEYGVPITDLDIGLVLESWWWPMRASGWGCWRCHLTHRHAGLIVIDLDQSAVAAALGGTGYCECHLYAGLFAGVFSGLAARDVSGVEIACAARGDERCQFIVASPQRCLRARDWRDQAVSAKDILRRLTNAGA